MLRVGLLCAVGVALYLWLYPPTFLRTDWWQRKALPGVVGALAFLYLLWPLDLIPGFGPISLVDDLIVVFAAYWWARQRMRMPQARPAAENTASTTGRSSHAWDPYVVLGVRPGASREEVTRAYREQMKRYHPDRVAGLGDELQRVAHEKTLDIQRAYQEVTRGS